MLVYWPGNESIQNRLPGRKLSVGCEFENVGVRRIIPAIYRFPAGMVVDVLTPLDEVKMRAFYDKYQDMEDTLSSAQRRAAESENPYQPIAIAQLDIDTQHFDSFSSTTHHCMPWLEESGVCRAVRKAYRRTLKDTTCFVLDRYTLAFDEQELPWWKSCLRWLFPKYIDRIDMKVHPVSRFFPIEQTYEFAYSDSGSQAEVFCHPLTRKEYTLHFQQMKQEEVHMPFGDQRIHVTQLGYEIIPSLEAGERLSFCANIPLPGLAPGSSDPSGLSGTSPEMEGAAAIGIIGGADGPTMMMLSSADRTTAKLGIHGQPLDYCVAMPTLEKNDTIQAVLDGIEKDLPSDADCLWRPNYPSFLGMVYRKLLDIISPSR